jgi:hypothetical protein
VFYIDVVKGDRDVAHVAMVFSSVCPECFICFRRMLQLFHLDIAKVDLDVAYTCMLQAYVVFSGGFIHTLQVFYLDVAYVFQWLQTCFPGVSNICCKRFNYFGCVLRVFHLDVAKVNLGVAHIAM